MSWGNAVQGGVGGAGTGAVVGGLAVPGVGAVPGAIIGGGLGMLAGGLSSDPSGPGPWNDWSGGAQSEHDALVQAQMMGGLGMQQSFAGGQNAMDAMYGRGTSVAQAQLAQSQRAYNQNAMAMAASARGVDPSAAYRQAMVGQQQMAGQTAQSAALLRAQEVAAARAQVLGAGALNVGFQQDQANNYSNRKENAYAGTASAQASIANANADRQGKTLGAFGGAAAGYALGRAGAGAGGGGGGGGAANSIGVGPTGTTGMF